MGRVDISARAMPSMTADVTRRRVTGAVTKPPASAPKPKAPKPVTTIGALELAAIQQEAWEAYDMQDERVRFDSLGRRWDFAPAIINDRAHMRFALTGRERFVSAAEYGKTSAREMSDGIVAELAAE